MSNFTEGVGSEALSENFKLTSLIQSVALTAFSDMGTRVNEWVKMDRALKAWKERQNAPMGQRLDASVEGQDYLDDVNVPIMHFILDTFVSQLSQIFFSRDVIWTYEGRTPDAIGGAKELTDAIRAAGDAFGHVKQLKDFIRNALKYGVGLMHLGWDTVEDPIYSMHNGKKSKTMRKRLSGCTLTNISPYRIIRDPAVPLDKIDKSRFIGHWYPITKMDAKRLWGVEIAASVNWNWLFANTPAGAEFGRLFNLSYLDNTMTLAADLYVDLIPADYGLSESTEPEVWHLVACGPNTIVKAKKANLPVGKYPYFGTVPTGDGYDLWPVAIMDLVTDMQALYNWLFNSRMTAVRSDLSGNYVVDPSMVNMEDVDNRDKNRSGNVFRIAQSAWGLPNATKDGMHRLDFSNNTQNYMQDANMVVEMAKQVVGTTDPIMGVDSPQSRRTAEEISSVRSAASSRIQNIAGIFHDCLFRPVGYAVGKYTQALLDHSIYTEVSDPDVSSEIAPEDLLIDFKTIVGDNYLTTDPAARLNSWNQMFNTVFQNPTLTASVNLVEMWKRWGKEMGIKDIGSLLSMQGIMGVKKQAIQQSGLTGAPPQ
jgi:hypothetical protein